jgi:serine phosphatase RsbU (regulator of sigma subunit)
VKSGGQAEQRTGSRGSRFRYGTSLLVAAIGVALTVGLVVATVNIHDTNEDRLLRQRVREAAAVVTVALPVVQIPLATAVEVVEVTDGSDQAAFRRVMSPLIESGGRYVSASLWRVDDDPPRPIVVIGKEPKLVSQPADVIRDYLNHSASTTTLGVIALLDGDDRRLGYSYTSTDLAVRYIAYAEAALPPSPRPPAPAGSAFSGLDNAIYLGATADPTRLLSSSTDDLPLRGRHASETVEFGDSTLLLVMAPKGELGGDLLARLPWLIGLIGTLATLGSASATARMSRRRDHAVQLAGENARLYAQQRSVSRELQQSLLPDVLPELDGITTAVRYLPGVEGVDIGGDWYDIIELDNNCLLIAIGDVSGRGLRAGTIMASLRYAIRAFASEGDPPGVILAKLSRLLDTTRDGHFATVLCATVNVQSRTLTIANAGHLSPLLISESRASMVDTKVGVPIGVTRSARYEQVSVVMPPRSTVLAYTDGLCERRGETIDVGLERLRLAAEGHHSDIDSLLDHLIRSQSDGTGHDDIAVLGVQWTN